MQEDIRKVRRLFVEKKKGFDVEAQFLLEDLKNNLAIKGLQSVKIVNRYDIQGINDEQYAKAKLLIFSEPPVDNIYEEYYPAPQGSRRFAVEYLPGQYDQRADSASQCVQILTMDKMPLCKSAKLIILEGDISDDEFIKIKEYCINPIEAREASEQKPDTLEDVLESVDMVEIINGFTSFGRQKLEEFLSQQGLAMSIEDISFCQKYFRDEEKRDPTITEIKLIDTYWSDHCRHTTFLTQIKNVEFEKSEYASLIEQQYQDYIRARDEIYDEHKKVEMPVCLMDIATIAMRELKLQGRLEDLDESDEINACSIIVEADVNGNKEEWLVMFKNETHNHPTEIEPFGGAATCLGGAIRDPLSGRAYVYQAMRVTGSGDPRTPVEKTIPGKLPQRKITTEAAAGYSSYGNQIGLATGQVVEIYDEGYAAKRMEIGAVIGAAPRKNVKRAKPSAGDVVILLGGRTGRDGCGGATGSSKEHNEESLFKCAAEVQKGNPITERKIQRLFRNPELTDLIKKCNDFGAGGVSVAVGELAEGLIINLDKIPKKYEGLDGTELAISESQERMAVVVSSGDEQRFIKLANDENLEATRIAEITDENRLVMLWRWTKIVDISRHFLDTNGVRQITDVKVKAPLSETIKNPFCEIDSYIKKNANDIKTMWMNNLSRLNVCSQKGLCERFDSTIGAGTILMPFGGAHQLTPQEGMAAKLPVVDGETSTCTLMSFGFNPSISKYSPFHGAAYAVVEAVCKIASMGGDISKVRLSLQEYFEKPGKNPERWGKPFAALLGARMAQKALGIPAIGGKDSMSGTFKDMDVPPTLVAFAVCASNAENIISCEFKKNSGKVLYIKCKNTAGDLPDFELIKKICSFIYEITKKKLAMSICSVKHDGLAGTITKLCFGNMIGFKFARYFTSDELFLPAYGSFVAEIKDEALEEVYEIARQYGLIKDREIQYLGNTMPDLKIEINGQSIDICDALNAWIQPLENVFPTKASFDKNDLLRAFSYEENQNSIKHKDVNILKSSVAKPRVFIPVFPGTNCEYDSKKPFEKAGAIVETMVFRNMNSEDIKESIIKMSDYIKKSQIVMIPGGFSAGDEPDGSGKFIATVFRNPLIEEEVMKLLKCRDGLMLGICNGFQALIKLGLVPYGEIRDFEECSPTLTYNTIDRHVSCMVRTRIVSKLSPWLANVNVGDVHTVPVSHGEGRFAANEEQIKSLFENGQVATQYVDFDNRPSNDIRFNPNGSAWAIEGITSPDGRVLGKMAHSERKGDFVCINVPGEKDQGIFEAGVRYFK